MTREELLERLLVERYGCNDWWHFKPPPRKATEPVMPLLPQVDDSEVTVARRRRELLAAVGQDYYEREATA